MVRDTAQQAAVGAGAGDMCLAVCDLTGRRQCTGHRGWCLGQSLLAWWRRAGCGRP